MHKNKLIYFKKFILKFICHRAAYRATCNRKEKKTSGLRDTALCKNQSYFLKMTQMCVLKGLIVRANNRKL